MAVLRIHLISCFQSSRMLILNSCIMIITLTIWHNSESKGEINYHNYVHNILLYIHGNMRRTVVVPLLGLLFRIPPAAWMSASGQCCVLSLRRTDPSSRGVLPSVVCLSVISKRQQWGALGAELGCYATGGKDIATCCMLSPRILHTPTCLWRWNSVPKRRHIKFRRRGITQKKAYNIHVVWNLCSITTSCNQDI